MVNSSYIQKTGENESELIKTIKKDERLSKEPDKRLRFLTMAETFLLDFSDNLYKTSLELHDMFPYYNIDEWMEFINYPIVRKYLQQFKNEKIGIIAEQNLAQGDKDAVSIQKAMQESGPSINNSNIVLIRVPEKVDFPEKFSGDGSSEVNEDR
jgi:hypothetical protein